MLRPLAVELPKRFSWSSCNAIFAFSSGVITSDDGRLASMPAVSLVSLWPCEGGHDQSASCKRGYAKNWTTRISVALLISVLEQS